MPSLRASLLLLAAATSTVVSGERLKAVWSAGDFSTISGPTGNESGHFKRFAIFDSAGKAIYSQPYPGDHSPCYNKGDGREFTIEGDCWDTARKFKCKSDFGAHPEYCEVKDKDGKSLGTGEGKSNTEFIGIAIGMSGACVVEFDAKSHNCPEDDGNGPLHVTSG